MKHLKVFYCSGDHMIYAEEHPDICKECGSMSFREVFGILVTTEDENGRTEESENDNC